MEKEEFKKMFGNILNDFDEILSLRNVAISKRPFESISLLMSHGILKFSNENDKDFVFSEGFTQVMKIIHEWYFERYGELARKNDSNMLKGIVLFYKTPLLIKFPQTTVEIEIEGESSWMIFSTHIEKNENTSDYFQSKINIKSLDNDKLNEFNSSLDKVVSLTRKISINLMIDKSSINEEKATKLSSIKRHIEKGIDDILTLNPESSVACWEFHLAIEKALKVYIKQKSGVKITGHNLKVLNEKASELGKSIDLELLEKLPSDSEAIKLRYLEMKLSIDDLLSIYLLTLEIINDITKDLDREISFQNSKLLIKKSGFAW